MKNTLLKRYFLSYLILLLVVFIALSAVFASLFTFARDQVETTVRGHFERVGNDFEERILSLRSTADLMQRNENLTRYRLSAGDYLSYNGIKELRKIRSFNSEIQDVFMYFQDETIYSARGKYEMTVYLEKALAAESADIPALRELFSGLAGESFYPLTSGASPASLLILIPMRSSGKTIGCVGFQYSIADKAAYRLDSSISSLRMETPEGLELLRLSQTEDGIDRADSESGAILYQHTTPAFGFYMEASVLPSRAFGGLYRERNISFAVMALVLAATVALSYGFSRRHYSPIKNLSSKAMARLPGMEKPGGNEFDAILHVLDREGLQNEMLSEKVHEISRLVRRQALRLLFSGGFESEEQAYDLLRRGEIRIAEPCFTVFFVVSEDSSVSTAVLEDVIEPLFGTCCTITVVDTPAVAGILGLKTQDVGRRERSEAASRIQKALSAGVRVCFGRAYQEPVDISRCYAEAMVCAEQSHLSATLLSPLFFETLTHQQETYRLPDEQRTDELLAAMERGDEGQIFVLFHKLMQCLLEDGPDPTFRRTVLQYRLYRFFREHQLNPDGVLDCNSGAPEVFAAQMEKWLQKQFPPAPSVNADRLAEDILLYIEQNYRDPNLDLPAIANRFHISENYFSRYFKQKTGKVYTRYLADLRLNEAHRLLNETNLPIYKIVQQVGYLDAVSFTKKFKRAFGQTPSALRLQHQKDNAHRQESEE